MKFKTLSIAFVLCLALTSVSVAADYAVIVGKGNPISSLSKNDLKQIFLGKKRSWPDGTKVTLYSMDDYEITSAFTTSVMNKSAQQFSTFWKKALFTGTGRPPVQVTNDAEMIQKLASDPGGIGYISKAAADDTVKIIQIN